MSALREAYEGIVCDLDGVVYRGPDAVPGAVDALMAAGVPIQYATNNASRPPEVVAEHLQSLGLNVISEVVATSSQAGAAALLERLGPGAPVLAVGGEGVALALLEAGLSVAAADEIPQAILQGYGPKVRAIDLAEAAYAVQGGAYWVATNADRTLPTDRGTAPGNGTLVAAVATAVGRGPDVIVGKPYAPLYLMCAARLGLPPARVLAIGDRLDTDIEGANAAGLDSLLVLTGVSGTEEAIVAPRELRPTYVADDLMVLGMDLEKPQLVGDTWICGGDRGRVVNGEWRSEATGNSAQGWTNRFYATYAALDAGLIQAAEAARIVRR